jgi:serine/threonine protein kinase/tetratricopeptide (TPR) repeat protein
MPHERSKRPPTHETTITADSFLQEAARVEPRTPSGLPDPARIAHFRIERRLGEGGMGVVYHAIDEKLERSIALKVLPRGFETEQELLGRFMREARSAAAITHPNIATIYDVGEADDHVYIAMELVEGLTLREHLRDDEPSVAECVRIARDVARGLGRAHEKGIVHRDLKPENIMISRRGEVKILDFGLAKLIEATDLASVAPPSPLAKTETDAQLSIEGRVVGTPAYMSPEQAKGETVDVRTDIFSFGVVLYELLAGTRPFHGSTSMGIMMSAARDDPKRVSEHNPHVSPQLDAVVTRCLAKQREGRYANGEELLAALEAVMTVGASETGARPSDATVLAAPLSDTRVPVSRPVSRLASGRLWGAGVVAVAVLALGRGMLHLGQSTAPTTVTSSANALPPAPSVVGLLDHPAPVTKSPEALAEYRRALTDIRDAVRPPQTSLEHAVQIDPEFAAAHLRLSMTKMPPTSTGVYREAQRFRDNLDARDQELLRAEEPAATGAPPDLAEAERRYVALHEAHPLDLEILMRLATIRERREPGSARATFREVIDLDPKMAGAALAAGDNERDADDLDKAGDYYKRCVELSPTATRCLSRLARLQAVNGRCDAYARDVTRILVLEPDDWFFRRDGVSAALTTGASEDSVRAAIDGVLTTRPGPRKAFYKERLGGDAALWAGAFGAAREAFARADSLAPEAGFSKALPVTLPERLTIAEELGSEDEVRAITRAYVGARSLTTPEDEVDGVVLTALRRHHVLPDDEVHRIRDAWKAEATRESQALVWLHYDAGIALTESEAREALASGTQEKISHDGLDANAKLGHVLFLAGQFPEAARRLELVAFNCALFQGDNSYVRLVAPAAYELGRADEGLGNSEGACNAYRRAIDLWGNATPRSATADRARARSRALHCKADAVPLTPNSL